MPRPLKSPPPRRAMIPRSSILLLAASLAITACQPATQSRPFAGRGGRNLDQPPRYGEPSRYVEPIAPQAGQVIDPNAAAAAGIDPRTIPPRSQHHASRQPPADHPRSGPGPDRHPAYRGPHCSSRSHTSGSHCSRPPRQPGGDTTGSHTSARPRRRARCTRCPRQAWLCLQPKGSEKDHQC